jgi:hypothetical protein
MGDPARAVIETRREGLAALVLALMSLCVAGSNSVMAWMVLLPATLVCALVLPIVVRPRGLIAWVLGFVLAVGLALGLMIVTAFMHMPLLDHNRGNPPNYHWAWLGYSVVAMVVSSAAWAGVLLTRAPERRGHALRIALLVALAYPFTALVYWALVMNGMPLTA